MKLLKDQKIFIYHRRVKKFLKKGQNRVIFDQSSPFFPLLYVSTLNI